MKKQLKILLSRFEPWWKWPTIEFHTLLGKVYWKKILDWQLYIIQNVLVSPHTSGWKDRIAGCRANAVSIKCRIYNYHRELCQILNYRSRYFHDSKSKMHSVLGIGWVVTFDLHVDVLVMSIKGHKTLQFVGRNKIAFKNCHVIFIVIAFWTLLLAQINLLCIVKIHSLCLLKPDSHKNTVWSYETKLIVFF